MASLRGLPPLPKSLSGVMDLEGIRLMEAEMGGQPARSSEHHSHRGPPPGPSSQSTQQQQDAHHGVGHRHHQIQPLAMPSAPHYLSAHQNGSQEPPPPGRGRKQSSLDGQLALLRQEMVGLRQLDLSLLSQLWSLNESIQEFRVLLQEEQEDMGMALSPPSPSSEDDDEDDGNGEFFTPARQPPPPHHHQQHYRPKRQRQQPGEGASGGGGKAGQGAKKASPFHMSDKRYPPPSSPSSPSSSTRSSFEFGEV